MLAVRLHDREIRLRQPGQQRVALERVIRVAAVARGGARDEHARVGHAPFIARQAEVARLQHGVRVRLRQVGDGRARALVDHLGRRHLVQVIEHTVQHGLDVGRVHRAVRRRVMHVQRMQHGVGRGRAFFLRRRRLLGGRGQRAGGQNQCRARLQTDFQASLLSVESLYLQIVHRLARPCGAQAEPAVGKRMRVAVREPRVAVHAHARAALVHRDLDAVVAVRLQQVRTVGVFVDEFADAVAVAAQPRRRIAVAADARVVHRQVVVVFELAAAREQVGALRVARHPEHVQVGQAVVLAALDDHAARKTDQDIAGQRALQPHGGAAVDVHHEPPVAVLDDVARRARVLGHVARQRTAEIVLEQDGTGPAPRRAFGLRRSGRRRSSQRHQEDRREPHCAASARSAKYGPSGLPGNAFRPATTRSALNSAPAAFVCVRASANSVFTLSAPIRL
ncbi:conserved hypothetical protein [Ricinus communis]|uniref:Uncharacterized protein n=1 Tax=Ricinus communis TaxID=3988 RepID=B9TGF8_RICCO|nr:conserved hypothetical protein [Ricinus communis]